MVWAAAGLFAVMCLSALFGGWVEQAWRQGRRWPRRWVGPRGHLLVIAAGGVGLSGGLFVTDESAIATYFLWATCPVFVAGGLLLAGVAVFGRAEWVARMTANSLGPLTAAQVGRPLIRRPNVRFRRAAPVVTLFTTDDRAFLAAIAASPDDDTPRLVYADWLDERSDPRGPYLRAAVAGRGVAELRPTVDAVWANMVSRPPDGVLVPGLTFTDGGPPVGAEFLAAIEKRYGHPLPADYAAFLLLHNGGVPSRRGLWPGADVQYAEVVRFYSSIDKLETEEPALLTPAVVHFEGNFADRVVPDDYRDVILVARLDMHADDSHERYFYLGLRLGAGSTPVEFHFHGNSGLMEMPVSQLPLSSFAAYLGGLV